MASLKTSCQFNSCSRVQQHPVVRKASARRAVISQFNRNPSTPPDAPKDRGVVGREWLETILSRFGPVKDRAQSVTVLEFEKPLIELDKRIKEVG